MSSAEIASTIEVESFLVSMALSIPARMPVTVTVSRVVACVLVLGLRGLLGGLRIDVGGKHHRCRCQRDAEQITFQLHHLIPLRLDL